jgi:hypothetical protein
MKLDKTAAAANLVSVETAMSEATNEDQDAWLLYLSQPNRPRKKAGFSVKEEYEQWLVARVSARHAAQPEPILPIEVAETV